MTRIRTSRLTLLALLAATVLPAACSSGPQRELNAGEQLAVWDFSEPRSFEEGAYTNATLRINDGHYLITLGSGDSEIWWGQWGEAHSDVVIDVDTEQLGEREETAFGVACRLRGQVGRQLPDAPLLELIVPGADDDADEDSVVVPEAPAADIANGDGYLFLIQGSGSWGIFRSRGRNLTPLHDWAPSEHIQRGRGGRNHLRAVCADDTLALYINDEFVAEVQDDSFASGQVGLAASAFTRLGAQISFDNLVVSEAVDG